MIFYYNEVISANIAAVFFLRRRRVKKRKKRLSLTLTTNSPRERGERGERDLGLVREANAPCLISRGDISLQVCKFGNFDSIKLIDSCLKPFFVSSQIDSFG